MHAGLTAVSSSSVPAKRQQSSETPGNPFFSPQPTIMQCCAISHSTCGKLQDPWIAAAQGTEWSPTNRRVGGSIPSPCCKHVQVSLSHWHWTPNCTRRFLPSACERAYEWANADFCCKVLWVVAETRKALHNYSPFTLVHFIFLFTFFCQQPRTAHRGICFLDSLIFSAPPQEMPSSLWTLKCSWTNAALTRNSVSGKS